MQSPEVTGLPLAQQEIKKMAREYALNHSSKYISADLIEDIINGFTKQMSNYYYFIGKSFIREQRLIIEFDKKQMLERPNPIGEQFALAGVYQAKLELINKLFGTDLFTEKKDET